ncbi:hypothetical protein D3C84_644610 [compost metagenome]
MQNGADKFTFDRVEMNTVDEMPVDFDVIRAQFRPQTQARIPSTEVIQGNRKAHVAVMVQGIEQQLEIVGRGLLGQFDNHPAGRYAEVMEHLQGASGLVLRLEQRLG